MATRTGYLARPLIGGMHTPGISEDLDEGGVAGWPRGYYDIGVRYGAGALVHTWPVASFAVERQGYVAHTYSDDFYHRIHIRPTRIDFGNITPPQTRTVEVWNAFLEAKTLTSITATGSAGGLTFSPSAPMTFQPNQSIVLTLTAGSDVAPTINATFTFNWIGATSAQVRVTGVSIIPVPWRQLIPMSETLAWLTDVQTAMDGTEQTISLRATPRATYAVTLHPKDFTGVQHAFVGGYGRGYAVPSMDEGEPCAVGAGALEILLDTSRGDWREMVMIWVDDDDFEIIEIDSVLSDRLLLKRPVSKSRTGRAYPTAAAILAADPIRTTHGRAKVAVVEANFTFTSGRDLAAVASTVQWNGYDVLMLAPMLHPVTDTFTQHIEILDNATGWPESDRYWDRAKIARPMRWVVNRAQLWQLRKWLHRRRGQWRPFYQPSFEPDFNVAGSGQIGNVLIIKANGYEQQGETKSLAIQTIGGGYTFADILGLTDNGNGTIGLSLSVTLSTVYADVQRVSLMGLKRLATDTVQINHLGGGMSEVITDFLEFQ
jgi:hypothetical protein